MQRDEPLNVDLLDWCMCEVKQRLAAEPSLSADGIDPVQLDLRLARAVLEGAELYPEDPVAIVDFALAMLPRHRASARESRVPLSPPPGFARSSLRRLM